MLLIGVIEWEEARTISAINNVEKSCQLIQEGKEISIKIWSSVASILSEWNELKKAVVWWRKALEGAIKLYGKTSSRVAEIQLNLGNSYLKLSRYYFDLLQIYQDQFNYAEQYIKESLQLRINLFGEKYSDTCYSLYALGALFLKYNLLEQALAQFNQCLTCRQSIYLNPDAEEVFICLLRKGETLYFLKQYDEALKIYQHCLTVAFERNKNDENYEIIKLLEAIGNIYTIKEQYDEALQNLLQCLELKKKFYKDEENNSIAITYSNIGNLYTKFNETESAIDSYEKAISIKKKVLPPYHDSIAILLTNLGQQYEALGSLEKALYCYKASLKIQRKNKGDNDPSISEFLFNMGLSCHNLNDDKLALDYVLRAYNLSKATEPKNEDFLNHVIQQIISLTKVTNNEQKLKEFQQLLLKQPSKEQFSLTGLQLNYLEMSEKKEDQQQQEQNQIQINQKITNNNNSQMNGIEVNNNRSIPILRTFNN